MKKYRNNGAVGAILDEYERAIADLKQVIAPISQRQLTTIVDSETQDPDCRSIQTILTHVVSSGYAYATYIRMWKGENLTFRERLTLPTVEDYLKALDDMFIYNERLFRDYPNLELETLDTAQKINVRWGQVYDVEQLMEHAIVHILRHRRQIERFLIHL